jgi:hypothetical protein
MVAYVDHLRRRDKQLAHPAAALPTESAWKKVGRGTR